VPARPSTRRFRLPLIALPSVALALVALTSTAASAQKSDFTISPYVSFLAPTGRTPLAGLALTIAGTPDFGIRVNARSALRNSYVGDFGFGTIMPPWGADIDAVTALSGHPFGSATRSASTFAFAGIGAAGRDTADVRVVAKNWSYGLGSVLPLGTILDFFADSRWRMDRFVLPTAKPHPPRVREIRFGLSFHVGNTNDGMSRPRRR
jgi:hypothetical protein